jgi:predicted transcriptional regulator
MENKGIREVFGVDWLLDKPALPDPEGSEFFRFVSRRVLIWLQEHTGNQGGLYEIVKSVGVDLKQLFGIVDYLTSHGFVEITKSDPLGNMEIKLTEQGKQYLQQLAR